jgi:hypothetical protein
VNSDCPVAFVLNSGAHSGNGCYSAPRSPQTIIRWLLAPGNRRRRPRARSKRPHKPRQFPNSRASRGAKFILAVRRLGKSALEKYLGHSQEFRPGFSRLSQCTYVRRRVHRSLTPDRRLSTPLFSKTINAASRTRLRMLLKLPIGWPRAAPTTNAYPQQTSATPISKISSRKKSRSQCLFLLLPPRIPGTTRRGAQPPNPALKSPLKTLNLSALDQPNLVVARHLRIRARKKCQNLSAPGGSAAARRARTALKPPRLDRMA